MIITSVNNDKIKDICKLNEKKYRDSKIDIKTFRKIRRFN